MSRWIYSLPGATMWAGFPGVAEQGILFFHPWDWDGFPPMTDGNWEELFDAHDQQPKPY